MNQENKSAAEEEQQPARVTHATFDSLVDQRIAEAQAEGLFDNLPGAGKPQRLEDDSLVPEDERSAFRLLKSSGFPLPWIAVRQQIEAARADLDAWLAQVSAGWQDIDPPQQAALREEYRQKLIHLQQMILNYNLRIPKGVAQISGITLQDELRRLGQPMECGAGA